MVSIIKLPESLSVYSSQRPIRPIRMEEKSGLYCIQKHRALIHTPMTIDPPPANTDIEESDANTQQQVKHAYTFMETHGQASFEDLQAMAESASAEDIEMLHELADDHDITYDEATDLHMLAEEIYRSMTEEDNSGISA